MSMLFKQFTRNERLTRSKTLVLKEARFPQGFVAFMNSLVIEGIVSMDYKRETGAIGFRWNDTRTNGGVLVETDHYPTSRTNGVVIFEGVPEALELVERQLKLHNVQYVSE